MKKHRKEEQPQDDEAVGLDRRIEKLESRRESREERRAAGELKSQRARGWTEKLLTRTMSGVIYVVIIVACFLLGIWPTAALVAAMSWLCCSEFFRICRMGGRRPNEICGLTIALAYPVVAAFFGRSMLVLVTFVLLLWAGAIYVFSPRANISDVAVTAFGPIYTSLMLTCLVLVRASNPGMQGAYLCLLVMGSIWAEDSMAYLVGSTLGKHKMAPRISPNKSWEGFFGGIVGALIVWCVGAFFHVGGLTWPIAIVCGVLESTVGVLGDLFESRIKRGVGVKDSGNILPGHGGMLDRTDSVIFGGAVAFMVLLIGGIII